MLAGWTFPKVELTMVAETGQPHLLGPVMRVPPRELKTECNKHQKDCVSAREQDLYVDSTQHVTGLLP